MRTHNTGRFPLMHHCWRHLLFLHWEVPAEELQKLIPPELEIDTYDGKAYAGLVPFTMHGIRFNCFPNSRLFTFAFHETNVRTYVTFRGKDPGVWFFSLDAASKPAVHFGRRVYRLPYHFAKMNLDVGNEVKYSCERLWPEPTPAKGEVTCRLYEETPAAEPGTLDDFLVNRYLLYSQRGGNLYKASVVHQPYPLRRAELLSAEENLLAASGISRPNASPLAHYSDGVDVKVMPLKRIRL